MALPAKEVKELVERAARRYEYENQARRKPFGPVQPVKVITVSRTMGSGGGEVARILGELLGCPVWDREILDVMADQGDTQARMLEALDETAHSEIEALLDSIAGSVGKKNYQYLLPKTIHIIARNDAIIVGRGAHLILPNAFKVSIKAPMADRVARLTDQLGLPDSRVRQQIEQSDRSRVAFLRDLSQMTRTSQPGDPHRQVDFDLELNTGRFTPHEAAEVILLAATKHFMRLVD